MADHKLLYYPDPFLQHKTHEVREFSRDLVELANDMRQIMKDHIGMGLAAIQVGDPRRLIIVELPEDKESREPGIPFTILINPKITKTGPRTDVMKEGCLSVPGVEVEIERATEVTVIAQDVHGEPLRIRAKGLFARILQHEIDHLNNVLILDYAQKPKEQNALKTMVWGSTSFTTEFLNTIMPNPHLAISHIVTEAPKPSGRGHEVTPTMAARYAATLTIPCLEPESLTDERFLTYLHTVKPDIIFVAAYGKLLPPEILDLPKYGCLNIHPSLLPKYRGATPIQSAILNGDKTTGVSLIKMSPKFDTGGLIAQSSFDLEGNETYGDLESFTAELGGQIVNEVIVDYVKGELGQQPQDENLVTYTKKISTADRWLNFDDPAEVNERKVRAFSPSPSAFVILNGQMVKVLSAHIANDILIFDEVQPAGKKPMSWADFQRGYRKELIFEPYKGILN